MRNIVDMEVVDLCEISGGKIIELTGNPDAHPYWLVRVTRMYLAKQQRLGGLDPAAPPKPREKSSYDTYIMTDGVEHCMVRDRDEWNTCWFGRPGGRVSLSRANSKRLATVIREWVTGNIGPCENKTDHF